MIRRVWCALGLATAIVAPAVGGTLHSLGSDGRLQSIDPATAQQITFPTQLDLPAEVVRWATGIGVHPTTGIVFGTAVLADACTLDPTRTVYANDNEGYGCTQFGEDECEHAFEVGDGTPFSCAWLGSAGCERCNSAEQGCLNTCAPPPICSATPARTRFVGVGADRCASHDGDPTACGEAYFVDTAGVSTCFADGSSCRGCDLPAAIAGQCTRGCTPPATCADPARTLFVGRANPGCETFGLDADACATAWTEYEGLSMSCGSNEGYCFTCWPGAENDGWCTNACRPAPTCPGDPARSRAAGCYLHDHDAEGCAGAFANHNEGTAACFLRDDGTCFPCLEDFERQGLCTNTCSPPVCQGDPGRTLVAGGPGGCHAFDGNQAGCEDAFQVGRCGEASCTYDTETASCRLCTPLDPAGCTNACGDFAPLYPPATHSLVTIDPDTVTGSVVTAIDAQIAQPTPAADGLVYATGGRSPDCEPEAALLAVDPANGSAELVAPLLDPVGGALALNPTDGLLYRLVRAAGGGETTLFATDPMTKMTTQTAVTGGEFQDPSAMTWAEACDAFVVASRYGDVLLLDPEAAALTETALHIANEYDEGDWPVGIVLAGDVCPILELPTTTTTTTTTSTSTSTSTSTTTLPNELLAGSRLSLADDPSRTSRRRLEIRSNDQSLDLGGGNGSDDDPVLHGGSLRVLSATGSFDTVYPLADGWRYVGKSGREKGYKRTSKGPIRTIVLRNGRSLEITGKGVALAHPLLVDPGDVRVVLRLGARQWCLEFGGTTVTRTPKKLVLRDAPAPSVCPPPRE